MEADLSGIRRRLRQRYGHQLGAPRNHRRIAVSWNEELSIFAGGPLPDDRATWGISAALQHAHGQRADAGVLARHKVIMNRYLGASDVMTRRPNLNSDRKSTRLNSSHLGISYAVFCLKK